MERSRKARRRGRWNGEDAMAALLWAREKAAAAETEWVGFISAEARAESAARDGAVPVRPKSKRARVLLLASE